MGYFYIESWWFGRHSFNIWRRNCQSACLIKLSTSRLSDKDTTSSLEVNLRTYLHLNKHIGSLKHHLPLQMRHMMYCCAFTFTKWKTDSWLKPELGAFCLPCTNVFWPVPDNFTTTYKSCSKYHWAKRGQYQAQMGLLKKLHSCYTGEGPLSSNKIEHQHW